MKTAKLVLDYSLLAGRSTRQTDLLDKNEAGRKTRFLCVVVKFYIKAILLFPPVFQLHKPLFVNETDITTVFPIASVRCTSLPLVLMSACPLEILHSQAARCILACIAGVHSMEFS